MNIIIYKNYNFTFDKLFFTNAENKTVIIYLYLLSYSTI